MTVSRALRDDGLVTDKTRKGAARRAGFRDAMKSAGLSAHRMIRFGTPPMSIKDGHFVGQNLQQY